MRETCLLTLFMPLPMAAPLCGVFTCRLRPATYQPAGADRYDPTQLWGRGDNHSSDLCLHTISPRCLLCFKIAPHYVRLLNILEFVNYVGTLSLRGGWPSLMRGWLGIVQDLRSSLARVSIRKRTFLIQSSLVINPSGIRHFDLRPVTFYDHFSL
jgi:hypothetical protein